ncbi:OmpH family outer membrane protein [Tabrizicola sp.]|uniref:OmpH family outer membrane protein n=1 Tax=Tabrizicola sp. TaxID=2005166 RepID=UPI003F2DF679
MRPGRTLWRAGQLALSAAAIAVFATSSLAQDAATPILTLDQDRFFVESAFGQAALERLRVATEALEQENKRIEAELVAEELSLTELRKSLPPEEFAAKADEFDAKVERIRAEQDAKTRAVTEGREKDRQDFLKVAVPVLGELMSEKQALVILNKSTVILSLSAIDITDEAIAKVDAALADPDPPTP